MIYNSDNYYVVKFGMDGQHAMLSTGGYEIVDKNLKRGIFPDGELIEHFRKDVKKSIASESAIEETDDFPDKFDAVATRPVAIH